MPALYRKYRPQKFAELIGQNHIKITLQNELERGEIGHAYLFCGPRGLGKTTTARLMAKSLNCENRGSSGNEPCDKCSSCLDIISSRNIDIIEIDAASHTGVDKVRENIIENIRFAPVKCKYKVFIIDEVHMLSLSAFNALLKTLEEPPAHVIFILCTTEVHKLPQTIISRCQRFDFKKVSKDEMLKRLKYIIKEENKKVEEEVLKNIILNSEGCIRDAESLLGKILTLGDNISQEQAELILPRADFRQVIALIQFLLEKNAAAAIELINKLIEEGVDLQIFTDNLIEFLRKVLLLKVNGNLSDFGIELDEGCQKDAEKLAERFAYEELLLMIELFMEKRQELKFVLIQQFPLEVAVIQLTEKCPLSKADNQDNNDLPPAGEGVGESVSVKNRLKDKLAHLNPRREQPPKTSLTEIITEKVEDTVRVNMLSPSGLKTKNNIDFKKIKSSWFLIIEKILEKNYTLAALLKASQPLKCRDNILEIGVRNNFYCERLKDLKNKKIVESVISEIIRAEVAIRAIVSADISPVEAPADNSGNVKTDMFETPVTTAIPAPPPARTGDAVQDVINMF